MNNESKTIAILTNILTPYRKFFYDSLNEECKKNNIKFYVIVMAESEHGRKWKYEDFKTDYTILLKNKTKKIGKIEVHFNKGIKNVYKKIKPDIVICGGSYLYPVIWRTIKLSKKFKFKVIEWSESHLNEERNYNLIKLRIREFLRRKVISKFDTFWCAGKFSKEFVQKYAKNNSKYIFVPNLINNKRYRIVDEISEQRKAFIKSRYHIDKDKKIYFTPARLIPEKGLIEFIDLYKKCENENCIYLIAGNGELKNELEEIINKNKLNIKLLGYRDEKEIIELYSISDGFILPSKSDANPLTCIEACWCHLPLLISSHVGNYPEVVKNGENGYVFNYNNEKKTIEIINKFINNPKEWYENARKISSLIAQEIYNPIDAVPRILKETLSTIKKGGSEK